MSTELTLRVIHGHRKGEEFPLPDGTSLSVGRDSGSDLVLLDKSISRTHCRFMITNGVCTVTDQESRNGVLVNEDRVSSVRLAPGDVIRIGGAVLKLVDDTMPEEGSRITRVVAAATGTGVTRLHLQDTYTRHPDVTVERYLHEHGRECAARVITWPQAAWYLLAALGLMLLLNYDWLYFLTFINLVLSAFYLVVIVYKLVTVLMAVFKKGEIQVSAEELAALNDAALPVYTILLPLYREPEVTDKIIRAVAALDYPADKLDVKILLEADDHQTLEVCLHNGLPDYCKVVVVPDAGPRTKPRACNHGLDLAQGEFLVIYDAEDRPEPDQLKKAVCAFNRYQEVPCFQSKLNYYNQDQNILTRWFTVEYSAWFDLYLPGLHRQNAPIPLGGTSNHFRTAVLKGLGGWDPFNVTEDADLGLRLYEHGYTTYVLDSTTWEEANSNLFNWIRQRSRWIKGYIQTHLVHMRNPLRTFRRLGPFGFCSFLFSVGGMAFMMLLNPLYWLAALLYGSLAASDLAQGRGLWEILSLPGPGRECNAWQMLFLSPTDARFWSAVSVIFFTAAIVLFVSNFIFIVINFLASFRRGLKGMVVINLCSPLYWCFISLAAWKGFAQLFYKPFYWEKTVHGLVSEDSV